MVSQLLSTISLQADVIVATTVIWGVVTFLFVGNKEAKERNARFMDESILAQRNINLNTLHRLQFIHNKLSKMDDPGNSDEARLFIFSLNDVYYELLEETMKTVTLYPSAQAVRIVGVIEQLHSNWKEWQKDPESILSFDFHALLKKACLEIAGLLFDSFAINANSELLNENEQENIRVRFKNIYLSPMIDSIDKYLKRSQNKT